LDTSQKVLEIGQARGGEGGGGGGGGGKKTILSGRGRPRWGGPSRTWVRGRGHRGREGVPQPKSPPHTGKELISKSGAEKKK